MKPMNQAAVEIETPTPVPMRKRARVEMLESLNQSNSALRVLHADADVSVDDLRYPAFWQRIVQNERVRIWDRFEVRAHDASWRLEMTVTKSSPAGLEFNVDKLTHVKPDTSQPDDSDGTYTIRYIGGQLPYSILRDLDGHEMPGRHASLDGARIARVRLHPKAQP